MKYLGLSDTSVKLFWDNNLRLKLIIESQFRTLMDNLSHSLTVEGSKELGYGLGCECIVQMLCVLRRSYVNLVSTVGGIKEQRHKGDRCLNFL